MQKLLPLSFLVIFAFSANCAFAKIWRLNNNPGGVNADFITLQAAHDGAAAGDTLYLEGSPTSYGSLQSSKKLIIVGPGYYQAENNIANVNTATAQVSTIYLYAGSQGSELMGLDFNGNGVYIYASDVVIKRNKFNSSSGSITSSSTLAQIIYGAGTIVLGAEANELFITQNFGLTISGGSVNTGVLITNNLIASHGYSGEGESNTQYSLSLHEFTSAIVQNNIFLRGKVKAYRSSFTNNIMVGGFYEPGENMAANNIGNGTQFGTDLGNKSNVDMSTVFVGTGSPDARWKLKAGSPAIGAGYGSTSTKPVDAGMFWGNTPYKLSGLPGIPVIYFINVQAVGSNADPIDVTVKVRSTN